METVSIFTTYRFLEVDDPDALRLRIEELARRENLLGTVLLAREGINASLAGSEPALRRLFAAVEGWLGAPLEVKAHRAQAPPFRKLRVRVRPEIVTFGEPHADPRTAVGEYVDARSFNEMLADPEVLVIDVRNDYEVAAGSFPGAIDPDTRDFREFADYVRNQLASEKERKVAMFCTGGIRCEKATSLLLHEGFSRVYHLEGGILRYLEDVPPEENAWRGECFVFDDRGTVGRDLSPGQMERCRMCGWPLSAADLEHPSYEEGVSCLHCEPRWTAQDKERARARRGSRRASTRSAPETSPG